MLKFLVISCFLFSFSSAKSQTNIDFYRSPVTKLEQFQPGTPNFVKLANGNILYARYTPPKTPSKATIVLMNGLPDTLNNWGKKEFLLIQKGYGVLSFDFRGQGYTLAYNSLNLGDLSWQGQVEDVKQLIDFFKIPKVIVSGLSYGGGIALAFAGTHPERILKVIAFAPFVEPVQPTENFLNKKVKDIQNIFPDTDPTSLFENLFRLVVYTTYPLAEPSVLAHPLKPEAITQMALGIRSLDLTKFIHRLPRKSLNLVGGKLDTLVPLEVIDRLWHRTPLSVRQSYTTLDAGHRITTWNSDFAAKLIEAIEQDKIYQPNSRLHLGLETVLTFKPEALSSKHQIAICRDIYLSAHN
jgi:pimeloyl-ACP methyl ester carboxylesterase